MKLFDLVSVCLRNLTRRKVSSLLTITGVVVGTCLILIMISMSLAMRKSLDNMLAQMGDLTVIQVYNYSGDPKVPKLDDAMLAQMKALEGVETLTPFYQPYEVSMGLYAGKNDRYQMMIWNMVGVYPEALPMLGYELLEGRYPESGEGGKDRIAVLAGQYAAYTVRDTRKRPGYDMIWPEPDPETGELPKPYIDITKEKLTLRTQMNDEKIKPIEKELYVVGTMKEDWSRGYETREGLLVDVQELKSLVTQYCKANNIKIEDNGYQNVKVKAASLKDVPAVEQAIKDMGFETWSMESIRKPMEERALQQQITLGALGGIALFVAAIGITNTMVMSIYERTREIGVMKVLGCELRDIRTMFLMEAGSIGFLGGTIGVVISVGVSYAMNYFALSAQQPDQGMGMALITGNMPGEAISIMPPWLIGLALVFSTLVGLISGYYPAGRAVKISSLEAIKHD